MEKKELPVVMTSSMVAERVDLPEVPRINLSWRDILICLVVGAISALISSYLTIERVAPRLLNQDSSEAARLAETMRDDWRQQYEDAINDRAELERTVAKLNAQVAKLTESIKQHEARLAAIQAHTPTYSEIKETIDHATRTNNGLQNEAVRILGELGVSRLRILD